MVYCPPPKSPIHEIIDAIKDVIDAIRGKNKPTIIH